MKLIYVNGFREDDKLSSTYLRLKEAGFDIEPCQWKYGDDVRKKIDECIQKIKPDLIVASSTAGLFVTDYDIPVVLINPVVDRKDLEKLHPDKDFSSYPKKPSNKSLYIKIILGEEDERLNYKKAIEFFKNRDLLVVENEGHRLKSINSILREIKKYQYIIKKELDFEFDPLILEFFTKEELSILIDNAMDLGDSTLIALKKDNEMFEITCDSHNVTIFDLRNKTSVTKEELFEKLKG